MSSADPVDAADPSTYPERVVVTVTVDDAPADTPVTVSNPAPLTDADPAVAEADQLYAPS